MLLAKIIVILVASVKAKEISNCDYFDTVDLTHSKKFANGSYEYEGVLIPADQTGIYNYKILSEGTRSSVDKHVRGCVCKFKACIRYCCHRHRLDLADERKCTKELGRTLAHITLADGTQIERDILEQFVVQPGIRIKCDKGFHIYPFHNTQKWKLFENGSLFRSDDAQYLTKRDYCIQPLEVSRTGRQYGLWKYNCQFDNSITRVDLISICLLLLTVLIHIFVVRLQHIHDKCYLCYLLCTLMSLSIKTLTNVETFLFGKSCYAAAYLAYFLDVTVYLWLTVLAYDLWRKFAFHMFEMDDNDSIRRFLGYNLFVWTTAFALLLMTILCDVFLDSLDIGINWKMGYAYYECYTKLTDWSWFIYSFTPVSILVICNISMVLMTAKRIYIETQRSKKQLQLFKHNAKNIQMRFRIYLRFVIIAMLNWLIALSVAIARLTNSLFPLLQNIIFYIILMRSILLFIATVYRTHVLQFLKCCRI